MWHLILADFRYRIWAVGIALLSVGLYPVLVIRSGMIDPSTIALSYISYFFGIFFFVWTIILQRRFEREKRLLMFARLPISANQRAFVVLFPVLLFTVILLIVNLLAFISLDELGRELRIWTFVSSALIWSTVYFEWIWIHEFGRVRLSRAGRAFYARLVILLVWITVVVFLIIFPMLFGKFLYKSWFTAVVLTVNLLTFAWVWLDLRFRRDWVN